MKAMTRPRPRPRPRLLPAALALLLASGAAQAQTPSMHLWITDPIGATDGSACQRPAPSLPSAAHLSEREVLAWNPQSATWTLDTRALGQGDDAALVNRCFVLALPGQPPVRGVVLARHSARLVRLPTLVVMDRPGRASAGIATVQLRPAFPGQGFTLLTEELAHAFQGKPDTEGKQ